ncbi:MAG TPA: sigma-54 dependent transcriptional regulator [Candidatus Glassbacteria bacterium]|nr:sigma-54 dependent transcriptional regulator [Candidatus Glassbacteria bacterium]
MTDTERLKYPRRPILIVDDEPATLRSFDVAMAASGFSNTLLCQDPRQVFPLLEKQEVELVLLDLVMPHLSGSEILARLNRDYPSLPVIMVTGLGEVSTVVQCMKQGAFDYVQKPADADRLVPSVRRAIEVRELELENLRLRQHILGAELEDPDAFSQIITRSDKMRSVFSYCEAIAGGVHPVLVSGETGTGKELIAEALHRVSRRRGDFVVVNVAGLDDNVFSDTLFGHVKGAFTGADSARAGLVEKAAGGTLFLDEIGDLDAESQIKLLRLLDRREYYPLGSDMPKPVEARIIVATQADLAGALELGRFRRDLYFRLRNHQVHLPPLRQRIEDLPLLVEHFIGLACREFGKPVPECEPALAESLASYSFPGNVRELKAMLLDAVSSHRAGRLRAAELLKNTGVLPVRPGRAEHRPAAGGESVFTPLEELPTLRQATDQLVREALLRTGHNQRAAARLLGISPQALNQRLKRAED